MTVQDLLYLATLLALSTTATSGYPLKNCHLYFNRTNSCPDLDWTYDRVNELCCPYQSEKELQCISTNTGSPDGTSKTTHTCDKTIDIPAGHGLSIDPERKEMQPVACQTGTYEPEDRASKDVHSDHCTKIKPKCDSSGEIRVCDGGTVSEDQCGCGGDHAPRTKECWHGLTAADKDFCACVESKCPAGTARNVTSMLLQCPKDERMATDYTCYPTTEATSTSPEPYPGSPEPYPGSTSPQPPESDKDGGSPNWLLIQLPILALVVVVVAVIAIIRFQCRKKVIAWLKHRLTRKRTEPFQPLRQSKLEE